jgi:hypothetical protein
MENLKYRVIYEYEFHRGTSAAKMARRVNDVYGGCVAKENGLFLVPTFSLWIFRPAEQAPWTAGEQRFDKQLKAIVEADPSQTTSELAGGCGVSGVTNKSFNPLEENWESLNSLKGITLRIIEANRQTRVDCCLTLLNLTSTIMKGFLN